MRRLRGGRFRASGVQFHPLAFATDKGAGLRAGLLVSIGAAQTEIQSQAPARPINGITPNALIDVRNANLNQPIPRTSPTWFDQAGAICNVKTLLPHDTSGYFSIGDTDPIKPIDKSSQELLSEIYGACMAGAMWPVHRAAGCRLLAAPQQQKNCAGWVYVRRRGA